jgi:predicted RNase H-like HicB family nuclease
MKVWYNVLMSTELTFRIEFEVDKESGQVTASIPELAHVSSFGDTFAEAEANAREAALGYLEVLAREQKEIPMPAFHTEGTYLKLLVPQST